MNNPKRRDTDDLKDEIRTALVSAFATCIVCGLIALYSDRATTTIVVMICGVGVILLLSAITAFFHFRRRDKLLPLTREGIMDIIRFEGYIPRLEEDGRIVFKVEGRPYRVNYDAPKLHLWHGFAVLPSEHKVKVAQIKELATAVSKGIIMAEIDVKEFPDEDMVGISVSLYAFCHYDEELRNTFPIYLDIIQEAMARFNQNLELLSNELPRRNDIYQPEFRWLPDVLFKAVTEKRITLEALTDEEWLRENIQNKASSPEMAKEWDLFRINRVDNYGDYKLIVYQFPEPKVVPEAKYGAVLLNTQSLEIDYYTLEKTFNDKWVYGSMSSESHNNYGEVDSPDLEKFIEWIFTKDKQIVASRDYTKERQETIN